MPTGENPTSPAAVGARLVTALEQYLTSASKRDDHLIKLLTVMSKLVADSQRAGVDMTPVVNALQNMNVSKSSGQSEEVLERTNQALDSMAGQFQSVMSEMSSILAKQTETNDMLIHMIHDHKGRMDEVEIKQIPTMSDEERRQDLQYVAYEEKELAFLKESEVFGALSDDTLRMILANSNLETHAPGDTVFTIGDPVSEVYIVKSGIAEICRPTDDPDKLNVVAYLTSGDSIGEMSILLGGDSRSSICRVPEGAEILLITHETFMKLFRALPELAIRLASVFARRLKTSIKKERIQTRHRELSGTLQYFDLPTVIQTLLSSDERTGVLTVYDDQQDAIAELFFEAGAIKYSKVGHLFGEESFYQLFQMDLSVGSFTFKERKFPEGFEQKAQINEPGMSLLFEAARLSDELKVLLEQIPDPNKQFTAKSEKLEWEEDESRTLANGIWNMLRRGATVQEILDSLPRSHYSIYSVLAQMLEAGMIE